MKKPLLANFSLSPSDITHTHHSATHTHTDSKRECERKKEREREREREKVPFFLEPTKILKRMNEERTERTDHEIEKTWKEGSYLGLFLSFDCYLLFDMLILVATYSLLIMNTLSTNSRSTQILY
jgi:hypothetical protein